MNSRVSYELVETVGVITIDNPPVNALSQAVRAGILDAIRASRADDSKAVLICCAGRTFSAGADISEFGKPPQEPFLPDLLNEIEASDKLVVAALHGTALGGGFETALACHYRIALDSASIGLPEVKLGLFPGAGGTQRIPRLAGVAAAVDLMASGKPITAARAAELGLVDKVVSGELREAALAYTNELLAAGAPVRRVSELDVDPVDSSLFDELRTTLARRARGQIAPLKMLESVQAALTLPFAEGLAQERELFLELMRGSQSNALRHVFFAERTAAKIRGLPRETPRREIKQVGIIGGGTMGGGIAMTFANADFPVVMLEINDAALARGLSIVDRNYDGSVKRGKLSASQATACRELISGTTDYAALAQCDLVIEAVFEDPKLKQDIFARLDKCCKDGAILATNTSYQDVDEIAAATDRPEDVIGLHFFSPAHIMKLLEVVRGEKTADDVLATCMALGKKIRKIPVMSGVCYGFIGNRMLQPYFREGQLCLIEGSTPERVDAAMQEWGMAMGPISVGDLAGLDVGYKAREALAIDERGDPKSFRVSDALVEMGRLGQKSGAGFYTYDAETRVKSSDPVVLEVIVQAAKALDVERREIDADEIVDRLIYSLVNEGLRVVEEGIAQRPSDIDVVYVYGYGFPAWRGGPMHYADAVGLDKVLARVTEFRDRFGAANWTPAPLLQKLAAEGSTIEAWAAAAANG
ncbi:MAG: enoyl-CoA hydratase/isomerase family protein [Proteobacteria bacterium]|nr:enoyl-CoA hydratase/isomerase family protein [Pseudomonadota bacterium]